MHADPAFNATWATFWDVLPGPDSVLTPELFTDRLMGMLLVAISVQMLLDGVATYFRAAPGL